MNSALGQVKQWLLDKCPELDDIDEDFELIESRVIDSLSFVSLVFLIEQASGESIDMDTLRVDDFRTLRRIGQRYFATSAETVPERLLRAERDNLMPLLRCCPVEVFDRPTVCTGWSIRDVLAHCAAALTGLTEESDYIASHERNQRDVELRRERPVEQILDEFEHGLTVAGRIIAEADGTKDLDAFGTWIHGGDVRDALGNSEAYASPGAEDALTLLAGCERVVTTPLVRLTLPDRELTLGTPIAGRQPASLSTDLATLFRLYTGRPAKPDHYRLRGATVDELCQRRVVSVRYLEDFHVGDTYDLGAIVVDEVAAMRFARAFDPQSFHVDPIAAKESWFGGLVVSGWFVAALFMRQFVDVLLADSACEGSPGVDQLRFHRPVRPGERLAARATVIAITRSLTRPSTGILQPRCEAVDPSGETVFSMILHSMFHRREGSDGSGV